MRTAQTRVVAILLVIAVLTRVLLRRPWVVEAVPSGMAGVGGPVHTRFTENVVGWRSAIRRRDEIAEKLRLGAYDTTTNAPS